MRAVYLCALVTALYVAACAEGGRASHDGGTDGAFDSGTIIDGGEDDGSRADGSGGARDTGTMDGGVADSGTTDSGRRDSSTADSGPTDSGRTDSGAPDTGTADSGGADTGTWVDGGGGPTRIDLTHGSDVTVAGDTTGGTTLDRPVVNETTPTGCPSVARAGFASRVPYDDRLLRNTSSGDLSVTIHLTGSHDTFILVYDGTSVPSDVLRCHAANDDGSDRSFSEITFSLAPGQVVLLLVTGYANTDYGTYTTRITAT